ncbi:MAG: hypothetical protein Q8941_20795 [Bacteroidota bacterium]|nr:hypothetical protein [Bacteroidota bacterium]
MTARRVLPALLIIGTAFALISWGYRQPSHSFRQYPSTNDTIPKEKKAEREKKVRDLDEALDELNNVDLKSEMEKAQKEMQLAMKELDGQKIKMEIEKAMKEVDMAKIQKEVQESMANLDLDMAKMQQELKTAMKEFDSEKVKGEIEKAMKEVDMEKLQEQVKESMAKVDWEKINKEMEGVKKMNFSKIDEGIAKAKEEMEKMGPKLEKEMQKAKAEIEKAKEEMKEYKGFVDGLEKDGLIKKSEGYSIKYKDGELLINGKKASNETYLKYRSFLEKHTKFNIEKNDDDFNINDD